MRRLERSHHEYKTTTVIIFSHNVVTTYVRKIENRSLEVKVEQETEQYGKVKDNDLGSEGRSKNVMNKAEMMNMEGIFERLRMRWSEYLYKIFSNTFPNHKKINGT